MVLSRIKPNIFFNILKEYGVISDDILPQFPLEFYQDEHFIYLFKTIGVKTYSTMMPIKYDIKFIDASILHEGRDIPYDEFINDLLMNYKAIELVKNYEFKLVLVQQ